MISLAQICEIFTEVEIVGREKIMYDGVFFSNSSRNIVQRSEAKRSENRTRIELYQASSRASRPPGRPVCTKQGRSIARLIGVHKVAWSTMAGNS